MADVPEICFSCHGLPWQVQCNKLCAHARTAQQATAGCMMRPPSHVDTLEDGGGRRQQGDEPTAGGRWFWQLG